MARIGHRQRLEALEQRAGAAGHRRQPLWISLPAGATDAEIEAALAQVGRPCKVYIGIGPEDWDDWDEDQ